jgi:signal transduction histidine kinase
MSDTPPGERVLVVSTTTQGDARIEVRDRGSGITPDALGKIFQPFVTTKPDGLGLGLAICRTIVAAHGGRISAANNPEGGATFVVSLPLTGAVSEIESRLTGDAGDPFLPGAEAARIWTNPAAWR